MNASAVTATNLRMAVIRLLTGTPYSVVKRMYKLPHASLAYVIPNYETADEYCECCFSSVIHQRWCDRMK